MKWNPARFSELLAELARRSRLGQVGLAELAGVAQSTISRWTYGESQPAYDALRRLVGEVILRHPDLEGLTKELVAAAGYGGEIQPPAVASDIRELFQALEAVPDPAARDRLRGIVEREMREIDKERRRRIRLLLDIIDLVGGTPSP